MVVCLLLFALLVTLAVAFYAYINSPITKIYATTRDDIETLLDPLNVDQQARLLARALPNDQLISAFGTQSTFVSNNVNLHRLFVKDAREHVQRWANDWTRFADIAKSLVEKYMKLVRRDLNGSTSLPFDGFVQAVTLAVILISFFGTDVNVLNFNEVLHVASAINERWRDSKDMKLSRDGLDEINDHLREWVPKTYPNPLDYIIPSYENIWRVVAIVVAEEYRSTRAHATCSNFLRNPDFDHFKRGNGDAYSVHTMIQESLRLYPPTRYILRAIEIQPPTLCRMLEIFGVRYRSLGVVDVQNCQRSSAWGPNPDVFDPSRHTSEEVEGNPGATLYAFGHGSMQCVAHTWAPHAAGILFAAIMGGFPPSGRCIIDNDGASIGEGEGWGHWKIKMSTI